MSNPVLCVSAGTLREKNEYKEYGGESLYLNYGLLGLATQLSNEGYPVIMVQGDTNSPEAVLAKLKALGPLRADYPMFLSIPSFYNVPWAAEFVRLVKGKGDIPVLAGGRWVIDRNLDWIRNKLPQVDHFVRGCPDERVTELLDTSNWTYEPEVQRYVTPFFHLDYKLLLHYKRYQPIIEVTRGCPAGCSFCLEHYYKACPPKAPAQVLDEAEQILTDYGTDRLNFYFEGSIFNPSPAWAEEFRREYRRRGLRFQFRMQSRVDTMSREALHLLSDAGLKVLDVGLESASPIQLRRMGKTDRPEEYLNRAQRLLKTAHRCGVWAKLNLLFYAGETEKTLSQTWDWLERMEPHFKGISCNPLTLYLNGDDTESYRRELEGLTGCPIPREGLEERGYTEFDLSPTLPMDRTRQVVNAFYRRFMTSQDHLDLKRVTYTPRKKE